MYRLHHIRVKNFRERDEINVTLADDNVTIIHGNNGSGKTTFLRVIHAVLNNDNAILESERINEALLIFKDIPNGNFIYIKATYSKELNEYVWSSDADNFDELSKELSSIVFGVNRGITVSSSYNNISPIDISRMVNHFNLSLPYSNTSTTIKRHIIEEMTDYLNEHVTLRTRRLKRHKSEIDFTQNHLMLDNLSMNHVEQLLIERYRFEKHYISVRVQNALFETLAQVVDDQSISNKEFDVLPDEFLERFDTYHETLLEVISELAENKLSNKIKQILLNYSKSKNEQKENPFKDKKLLSNLVYNMMIELETGKGVINSVSQLVEEFNSYLTRNKKLDIDETGVRIKTENSKHDINKLSSGERHLLSFLTLFIIGGRNRSILMIDEPEISLNLEWQSKLLKLLTKFVPTSQIIVATHSPAIAEYNSNNLVDLDSAYEDMKMVEFE